MSSSRRRPELRLSISQGRDGSQYHRGGTPEKSPSSGKYFLLTSPFIEQIIFWASPGACGSPAQIWPRRAASECAATLSLDLDSFLKSFRGSQPSLALIGSAARARRFQPVYSAGARVALDRLLAAMPAAGHVSKGIMSCRLVHYRAKPEAVPIGVRSLSRAGFQRGNTLA